MIYKCRITGKRCIKCSPGPCESREIIVVERKCELCGKTFELEDDNDNRMSIYHSTMENHYKNFRCIDLCPECAAAINKTIEERKCNTGK